MIKRKIQVITSKYGWRILFGKPNFHRGVDLRSYNDNLTKRLPAILPEECEFVRRKYQKRWGWTLIFKPLKTAGYCYLKFTHIEDNEKFIVGEKYKKNEIVSYSARTKFMIKKKVGEHVHFETWRWGKKIKIIKRFIDPEIYLEIRDIPKRRK